MKPLVKREKLGLKITNSNRLLFAPNSIRQQCLNIFSPCIYFQQKLFTKLFNNNFLNAFGCIINCKYYLRFYDCSNQYCYKTYAREDNKETLIRGPISFALITNVVKLLKQFKRRPTV